ncbi:MAG: glycosyltransferase family 2 protein [Alphaproteobacteria bacterium]|nr:glycosyltransferase family 2 protein [Alphaproteobacteria bacterium]
MTQKLSIVIPCFNEKDNMPLVLRRFEELMKDRDDIELIVVDGFSTDETPAILTQLFKKLNHQYFKLILKQQRGGYGRDILDGLDSASGNVLAWTHADMQTDPKDVFDAFNLYKSFEHDQVFIKGARQNRPLMDVLFTWGMFVVVLFTLKVKLTDINAQPKIFSKNFYQKHMQKAAPSDFSLDLYAYYQAKRTGLKIVTIPVIFADRVHGEAKGGGGSFKMKWNLINRTFKYIFALKKII